MPKIFWKPQLTIWFEPFNLFYLLGLKFQVKYKMELFIQALQQLYSFLVSFQDSFKSFDISIVFDFVLQVNFFCKHLLKSFFPWNW